MNHGSLNNEPSSCALQLITFALHLILYAFYFVPSDLCLDNMNIIINQHHLPCALRTFHYTLHITLHPVPYVPLTLRPSLS